MTDNITTIFDKKLAQRYQFQSWVVRRWRDRFLFKIPFIAIKHWWRGTWNMSWSNCWSYACGDADVSRKYYFTSEECKYMEENNLTVKDFLKSNEI